MRTIPWIAFLAAVSVQGTPALAGKTRVEIRQAPYTGGESRASDTRSLDAMLSAGGAGGREAKSTTRAVLYSLLLPGLGHRYLGDTGGARVFFATEAVVWTSFTVFEVEGHLRKDGYREFARQFASVASTSHSDDYYKLLTRFNSSTDYESQIKSEGRAQFFPDGDAAMLEAYWVANRVSDFAPWAWTTDGTRRAYQQRRTASRRAFRRGIYALAVAAANRVASAFLAVKSSRELQRRSRAEQTGFRLEFGPPRPRAGDGFQTGVSLVRQF